MNPSSPGWIKKLMLLLENQKDFLNLPSIHYYNSLKETGFIYGSNMSIVYDLLEKKDLTDIEIGKINLLTTLYYTHKRHNSTEPILKNLIKFYKEIKVHRPSFFSRLINGQSTDVQLEKLIHKRIQIDDNILTKNFNYFVINALLYVDVLAYQEYLINNRVSEKYMKNLEASIETIVYDVLRSKSNKTEHDEGLIKLFQSSLRYQNNDHLSFEQANKLLTRENEKWYVLDLACMSTWSDRIIDEEEQKFLHNLGKQLELPKESIKMAIKSVNTFYTNNADNIALLSSRNIVKNFYDNSSKMVSKLISRNRKRLYKELLQSKDVVVLIGQSTLRDLTDEEQKRLQEQLVDIIKAIPSLAIFMLPGGALLLPLFVKFIPKLLPSAFDDNRIEDT